MKSIKPSEAAVIETVKTTEPIISIEVSVAKASEARGWIHHGTAVHWHPSHRMWRETAAHSHPSHRTTVPSHLRRRSRGCENTYGYATKENDFFRVHNFVPFKKLNPSGFESIAVAAFEG
jgi:hypothetical protein